MEEMPLGKALARDELERLTLRLPEDQLRRTVRKSQPDIGPELLERTIEYMKEKLANDPFALLQPVPAGEDGREFQTLRSISLESALFVAHLTGAAIYTDEPASWRQLHEHTSAVEDAGRASQWEPLAEKLTSLKFTVEANPLINLEVRISEKLVRVRRVFRRIWDTALAQGKDADLYEIAGELAMSLEKANVKAGIEWNTCNTTTGPSARFRQHIEFSAPAAGFDVNSVHRLLITFGSTNYIKSLPIALFINREAHADRTRPGRSQYRA